jgi:TctA family transporter
VNAPSEPIGVTAARAGNQAISPRNLPKIWMLSATIPGNRITSATMISMMITHGIEPQRMSSLLIEGGAMERR